MRNARAHDLPTDFRVSSSVTLRRPRGEVFDFYSKTENLELLMPPRLHFAILTPGPYCEWVHQHTSEETLEGTLAVDEVWYRAPGGPVVNRLLVAGELKRIFDYRKAKLLELFS